MNAEEVSEFLRHHKALHPDFAAWSSELETESKQAMVAAWSKTFADVSLESAKEVSERMLAGELEELKPWDFKKLAGFVRRNARQQSVFRLSGWDNKTGREPTYHCHYCRDTGYREVFHPNSVKAVAGGLDVNDEKVAKRLHTCALLCDCRAGKGILDAQGAKWSKSQVFDAKEWCECPLGDTVRHASDLVSWIEAKKDIKNHPAYESSFGDWNAGLPIGDR